MTGPTSTPWVGSASGSTGGGNQSSLAAAEKAREDAAAAASAWQAAAPALRPWDLVFVDESGTATTTAGVYGWAKGGLSLAGLGACLTVENAAATDVQRASTRAVLMQALRPGQVVALDTQAPERPRDARVRQLVEATGGTPRFPPPVLTQLQPDRGDVE